MKTKLITLEVSLLALPSKLRQAMAGSNRLRSDALRSHVRSQLSQHGDPLRWAITHIDPSTNTAHIEAVVTSLK